MLDHSTLQSLQITDQKMFPLSSVGLVPWAELKIWA